MSPSFEEKSVWIQLVALLVALGAYFVVAGNMIAKGVTAMPAYAALFMTSTVLMVILLIVGFIIAALTRKPEPRDERDRIIAWRAEHHSSWVVAVGSFTAITAMVVSLDNVWTAHILLLSLALSHVLCYVLQLISYRRGV